MDENYKAELRHLVEKKGVPVEINRDAEYDFDEVSTYGWVDHEARDHATAHYPGENGCARYDDTLYPCTRHDACEWIIPTGAELKERTYSQFADTDSSNVNEVGINVYPAHCACGKYKDVTLRYTASLAETLRELFGKDEKVMTL